MEHEDIRRKLAAYLDNAVAAEEKEEIKRHLGSCGSCRTELADLEHTLSHLKNIPEVEPPPWLVDSIMTKVRENAEPRQRSWPRLSSLLRVMFPIGVVALAFLGVAGYYLLRTLAPQAPSATQAPMVREKASLPPPSPVPAPFVSRLLSGKPEKPPAAPSPVPPAVSGQTATVPQTVSPVTEANPPAPALPARPTTEPELQPAAEGFVPERELGRSPAKGQRTATVGVPQRKNEAADDHVPAAEVEIALEVRDAASAAEAIEKAVNRIGGRINGHAYGDESHILSTQIEAGRLPELIARLRRIGMVEAQPRIAEGASGAVDLVIRW